MSDTDTITEPLNITIALIHTSPGKRRMQLIIYSGKGKKAANIIATQDIDLFRDHLPTMARTATTLLRTMYTVHLDPTITAILKTEINA